MEVLECGEGVLEWRGSARVGKGVQGWSARVKKEVQGGLLE